MTRDEQDDGQERWQVHDICMRNVWRAHVTFAVAPLSVITPEAL
jgi:hypothetical protein